MIDHATPEADMSALALAGEAEGFNERLTHRFRALRVERRLTLDDVSERCGVSRSMLSQIERGRVNPSILMAHRLASAYGVSLAELIEQAEPAPALEVLTRDQCEVVLERPNGCRVERTFPVRLDAIARGVRFRLTPTSSWSPEFVPCARWIIVIVESGRLGCDIGGESWTVAAGDVGVTDARSELTLTSADRGEVTGHLIHICQESI